MISPVIIKGNKMGLRLIVAYEADIDIIIDELIKKLQNTKQYYKNIKPITVTFEGKILTEDEITIVLDTLRNLGLNIKTNISPPEIPTDKQQNIPPDEDGLFYLGNLKNGQSIEASESIIIVGDVEQGACVYSKGNIIIIGRLNGYAEAGYQGNEDAFVYTLFSGRN
ncbi:MAG: hypothetical protein E7259_02920 [Lachnospiraceae bacterium]|nr:hypothetical protein [Lachnospiraceae bacterium]